MNNQHVKIKGMAGSKVETNNDLSVRKSNLNDQNKPNVGAPGHKKANSLMNQKMMQLLLNKEYGNNFQNNNIGGNQ